MNKNSYSFKTTGLERKEIAGVISEALGVPMKYVGPPSFAYEVGLYKIDRDGIITAPADENLAEVLAALKEKNVATEGDGIITIPMEQHTGVSLRNLVNIIYTKEKLLQKALDRSEPLVPSQLVEQINSARIENAVDFAELVREQDTGALRFYIERKAIQFSFFNASLESEKIKAYSVLCTALDEQAKKQKRTGFLQKDTDNPKYAFRCFLLRLGFIGAELKTERKVLMANLEGNGAYRSKPVKNEEAVC